MAAVADVLFTRVPGVMSPRTLPTAAPAVPGSPRVVGLDLSIARTGIARADGSTQAVTNRPADGDARLLKIRTALQDVFDMDAPDLVSIEDLPRDSHAAKIVGFVHGIARAEMAARRIPYVLITGATLKCYAADHGRASKEDMAAAAYLAAGAEFLGDRGGDECDAWWLRAAALDHYGSPVCSLPQAQRDRLAKVKWPEVIW